jgi:surface protein
VLVKFLRVNNEYFGSKLYFVLLLASAVGVSCSNLNSDRTGSSVEQGPLILVYNTALPTYDGEFTNEVSLPLAGDVDVSIDWGNDDANESCPRTADESGELRCEYPAPGTYTVRIEGQLTHWGGVCVALGNGNSAFGRLVEVETWGGVGLESLEWGFCAENNLVAVPSWLPSTVTDLSGVFASCEKFNGDITGWNTANVTSMASAFEYAEDFNQNIGNWDTSKVTDMSDMFNSATAFNGDISNWKVGSVTNMRRLFYNAVAFNQNLNNWDVRNVTDMRQLFKLATLFNGDVTGWNVGGVTEMLEMFQNASSFNQDLSGWNVENAECTPGPNNFDDGATSWSLDRPNWRECPGI